MERRRRERIEPTHCINWAILMSTSLEIYVVMLESGFGEHADGYAGRRFPFGVRS